MALKFLLDSNIWSEPMKPQPNPGVLTRLHRHGDELAMSSVSWHELLHGVWRMPAGKRRDRIERYTLDIINKNIPILPYTRAAARWHAEQRVKLTRMGLTPAFVDSQIASIAATNGLTLVTRNTKDFAHFTNLIVEDWFS